MSDPPLDLNTGLAAIRAAAERIAGHVRRTPVIAAHPALQPLPAEVWLKLENLQVSGSFKARGAVSKITALDPGARQRGIVTASGGNHGLGVAWAASRCGTTAVVYVPENTPEEKVDKLEAFGAQVEVIGAVWDDANREAIAAAELEGRTYVHPFADRAVIAGQGTATLELFEQGVEPDVLVVAVGGGGLISGAALVARALHPNVRIVGVEPKGAATLHRSLAANEIVTLDRITTHATSLAPRRSEPITFDLIRDLVDDIVLVSDAEMRAAARWLWLEMGVSAELAAAAGVAAIQKQTVGLKPGQSACAIVCGAGAPTYGS